MGPFTLPSAVDPKEEAVGEPEGARRCQECNRKRKKGAQLKEVVDWGQHGKMGAQEKQISRIPKLTVPWVEQCRLQRVNIKL